MTVLQPGHDSRVPWPSTCLLGCIAPKLPSKEGPVDPRRSILCSTPGVAVVGKFRSRIRLLQFSTRKITPHGNVYISSAIRPIGVLVFWFLLFRCGTNLGIAYPTVPRGVSPLCPTTLRRARRLKGLLLPASMRSWPCAARTPMHQKAW